MNRKNLGLVILVSLWFFGCTNNQLDDGSEDSRPNILLIVADDLGYADMGAYGGDIETPNLDALAASGIRFSRFHTAPLCAVTRAMLLSGNNNHIAGMGVQGLQTQIPGYEGHLTDRIIPLPALLQSAGYHTYMAGKWHLGDRLEDGPMAKGFEHSFSINGEGAANHYSNLGIFSESAITGYTEDGEKADWKEGDYSTDFYTDKLISYIDRHREDGKPFFTFAAYTSPHWPLQVDEKYWKKYEGRYDDGYESLKEKRFESLKKAGMIPQDAVLPKTHPSVKAWDSLSPEEQKKEVRKMELYAGMVDNLDYNIGRLINHLKETGQYENTLIVFMSDNGAAAEDFYYHESLGPFIKEHYSDEYSEMGKVNSFISYGAQWAEAGSSPFKYFKGYTTEGGINTPMIVAGPGVENNGKINDSFLTLMDFAPTFYELANVQYPNEWKGKVVKPLLGKSILPLLSGKSTTVHDSTFVFGLELEGYSMIRKGDWKIVNIDWPFLLENFQLMNLQTDLAEQQDLKEIYPEKYQEMLAEWERFSKEVGVVYPTPSPESN
ncbi:arylsulfatase [Algoriphagus lutimaris]|uniref:arylsulfatase n=1 Tax=Algoriphagus lutimaris TaxID=613197 RepID=UPI00196A7B87|nr:arylsulfatase [Algoriphagus lutimaris]MBN3520946.1 arylsulfatase [Algoriphagus lutimaris]